MYVGDRVSALFVRVSALFVIRIYMILQLDSALRLQSIFDSAVSSEGSSLENQLSI